MDRVGSSSGNQLGPKAASTDYTDRHAHVSPHGCEGLCGFLPKSISVGSIKILLYLTCVSAGTVMGVTNTLANKAGFLAPQMVGWLADEEVSDDVSDCSISFSLIALPYRQLVHSHLEACEGLDSGYGKYAFTPVFPTIGLL